MFPQIVNGHGFLFGNTSGTILNEKRDAACPVSRVPQED